MSDRDEVERATPDGPVASIHARRSMGGRGHASGGGPAGPPYVSGEALTIDDAAHEALTIDDPSHDPLTTD